MTDGEKTYPVIMEASSPVQTGTIQVTVSMETQNEKKNRGLELIRSRLLSYMFYCLISENMHHY